MSFIFMDNDPFRKIESVIESLKNDCSRDDIEKLIAVSYGLDFILNDFDVLIDPENRKVLKEFLKSEGYKLNFKTPPTLSITNLLYGTKLSKHYNNNYILTLRILMNNIIEKEDSFYEEYIKFLPGKPVDTKFKLVAFFEALLHDKLYDIKKKFILFGSDIYTPREENFKLIYKLVNHASDLEDTFKKASKENFMDNLMETVDKTVTEEFVENLSNK